MSEGSDINVGSIEEDIKILENLIVTLPNFHLGGSESIRNILQDYKRQKQINEEHRKLNGELRERVKELDTENNKLLKELYNAHCIISDLSNKVKELEQEIEKINKQLDLDYVEENYIPKQAVIDKIGKLKNEYDKKYDLYMGYKIESREQQDILKQMEILQELLEGESK